MTNEARQIYLLSSREYSEETIAVAFAKTSRSPETFKANADELSEESASQFHEKWVVGYGHSSVAEHAVLHIAIENASRLSMEYIEGNRFASYTEKSTRYQKWDTNAYYTPKEIVGTPFEKHYHLISQNLFQAYVDCLPRLREVIEGDFPRKEGEADQAYDNRIRSKYVDHARFLLPASSLANVGVTINGRALEYAITKWLSAPLNEIREIGEEVKAKAMGEAPTLIKYAEKNERTIAVREKLAIKTNAYDWEKTRRQSCVLVASESDSEDQIIAAILYRFGNMSYQQSLEMVKTKTNIDAIIADLFDNIQKFDTPIRELEHSKITFDLVMDQGAYAEFKRHRVMTQTPQALTCELGYAAPMLFERADILDKYKQAMDSAGMLWNELSEWNRDVAQYIVPNGYNRGVLASMNLREAFAFCQLRTAKNAHFSIRRIAQMMAVEIKRAYPMLGNYLPVIDEHWQNIERDHFTQIS